MTLLLPALGAWLAGRGHGVYSTTTPYAAADVAIVVGGMPPTPDRCLTLSIHSGPESLAAEPYDHAYIRLRVRGTLDVLDSATRAQALYDELHGLANADVGGVWLTNAYCVGPVTSAGVDDNSRHEHVLNVHVEYGNPARA